MFYQLYEALEQADAIEVFEEDDPPDLTRIKKGGIVEISRFCEPSPVNEAIDSLLKFMNIAGNLGIGAPEGGQEEEKIRIVGQLLGGTQEEKETPMISTDEEGFSVVYTIKNRFIDSSCSEEDLIGDMTVFGKINRVVPENSSIDLIDLLGLLKNLPRKMRRSVSIADLKKNLLDGFAAFPEALGGPIAREEFTVHGPAVIVTPVAVYTI